MRKFLPFYFLLFLLMAYTAQGQLGQVIIDSFESAEPESLYLINSEGAPSRLELTQNTADFVDGSASLDLNAVVGSFHTWGSFVEFSYTAPSGTGPWDWSLSDSLSLWLKVRVAPTIPATFLLRVNLYDQLTTGGNMDRYIYENIGVLDQVSGWINLRMPLVQKTSDGSVNPDSTGFVIIPSNWNPPPSNNRILDFDKIVRYQFDLVVSGSGTGNLPADSMQVTFDKFNRFGFKKTPFIYFNGKVLASRLTSWTWGGSAMGVEENAGSEEGTNAMKWVQGAGWTGFGFDISPADNMTAVWASDSVKFRMKAQSGTGALRIQFEDGTAKKGTVFTPTADGNWYTYAFKLSEMVYQDGTSNFDSTSITKLGLMAENSGVNGNEVYIDFLWTGNPVIDVAPPPKVLNFVVVPDAVNFYNLMSWSDLPNELNESYLIFVSDKAITNVDDPKVERLLTVREGENSAIHYPRYPLVDQSVNLYYAIQAQDEAGNVGLISAKGPITNTAKGIATFSQTPPANLVIDGDVPEWELSGIVPYVLKRSNVATTFVSRGVVTDDADITATIYLAMDDANLYIGALLFDDDYEFTTGNWWEQDALEIFIGLYNSVGTKHTAFRRGSEPDYKLILKTDELAREPSWKTLALPGSAFYQFQDWGGGEYSYEAVIPFDSVRQEGDDLFVPERGMRIPLEITVHDRDNSASEGNLVMSPYNKDNAYLTPSVWSHTWVGDTVSTGVIGDNNSVLNSYELRQNYPNPFNPLTTIEYSIGRASLVTLDVYNILGQRVRNLVNQKQASGRYQISFDGKDLASGVYFYQIKAGDFSTIKKMLLIK